MNIKTYSSKSNAKRAALAANGDISHMQLMGEEGKWYYGEVTTRAKLAKEKSAKAAPKAKVEEVHPDVARLNAQLDASKARLQKKSDKPKPAPAPKAPRAKKEGTYAQMQANRNTTSTVENPVRAMWDLCDAMTGSKRKDVIAAAVEQGINYYTARTQYQLWLTAWRNSQSN